MWSFQSYSTFTITQTSTDHASFSATTRGLNVQKHPFYPTVPNFVFTQFSTLTVQLVYLKNMKTFLFNMKTANLIAKNREIIDEEKRFLRLTLGFKQVGSLFVTLSKLCWNLRNTKKGNKYLENCILLIVLTKAKLYFKNFSSLKKCQDIA